jgi:small GTP-binding protein
MEMMIMLSWILTDGTDKVLATKNGGIGIDEKVVARIVTSIIEKSEKRSMEVGRLDLPNSTLFYRNLSIDDNIPFCLFIKTGKSMELLRIEPVFNEVALVAKKYSCDKEISKENFDVFTSEITTALNKIKIKVLFMGYGGVGKTTMQKLLRGDELPLVHDPTIGVDVVNLTSNINLFDTAGQIGYLRLLPLYIKGSDLVVVVSDSSLQNALLTRKLVESLKEVSNAKFVLIANKQDLTTALVPERVAQIVGVSEYIGMLALDFKQREKLIGFIESQMKI